MLPRCSKSVRRLDQWDLRDLESLRPLVASSLRSERYAELRAVGILNRVDPLVSASNLYLEHSSTKHCSLIGQLDLWGGLLNLIASAQLRRFPERIKIHFFL